MLNKEYLQAYTASNTFICYIHASMTKAMSWLKKISSSLGWPDQFTCQALIDFRLYTCSTGLHTLVIYSWSSKLLGHANPLNMCIVPLASSHCSLISFRMGLYTATTFCNWSPVAKKVTYTHSIVSFYSSAILKWEICNKIFAGAYIVSTLLCHLRVGFMQKIH